MAEVNVSIHGKPYGISCDDGQEDRVKEVGRYVDGRASDIASAGAATNENHLLVLTALVLADEVKVMHDDIVQLKDQLEDFKSSGDIGASSLDKEVPEEQEQEIMKTIEFLQNRLDSVAKRLQNL